MLTGEELGAAIESARLKKNITKLKLAEDFGVKPPSVQGWVKTGRIDKSKLMDLIAYFQDVVGPEHWGLRHGAAVGLAPDDECVCASPEDFNLLLGKLGTASKKASPASQQTINRIIGLAEQGTLDDSAWKLINDLLTELSKK
ncbi:helix-turn-helix domain-containing protein [Pseudomonas palmensis]